MPKVHGKQIKDATVTTTQAETATGTIATVNAGDAAVTGTSVGLSHKDHQHAVSTAAPGASTCSAGTPAEGASSSLMRADASIQADVSGTLDDLAVGQSSSAGTGNGLSLKTHAHAVPAATAIEITDSTSSAGTGGNFVHANHQHAHGNRSGGALHSSVTTSVNGFMSAADKTKLDALIDPNIMSPKEAVRLLATGTVTLTGNQAVDGVTTAPGERVALFAQSTGTQNGIYITNAGAWTRADDFALGSGQSGSVFPVQEGTANDDTLWIVTNDPGSDVVGTDTLAVLQIGAGSHRGAGAGLQLSVNDLLVGQNADNSITVNANDIQVGILATDAQHGARGGGTQHAVAIAGGANGFMSGTDKTKLNGIATGAEVNSTPNDEDVTTQIITGADTALTDTLANTPIASTLKVFLNGVWQEPGAGKDYTISGTTITWLASSGTAVDMETTDVLRATYLS